MADEKKQQKLKHPRKSPLGLSPKDLASSIPMLLWKLGDALGCKRSRLEYGKAFIKPKTHMQIKLNDFRQRFKQLQSTADVEEQCLQEHRYKLFLHLYRLLLRLEPNETKRQEYLAFCYHMFDEKNPQKMQLEGKLKYQEDFTENLICLAQNVLHLNEKELEISSSREQTETILQMGFLYVICKPVLNRCQLKCLRWERAICVKNYNPMNRNANKEEPKLIRDTELKIIYMAHPKSSEQSSPLSSDVMDCEDIESELRAFSQGWKLNAAEKNSKPFSFLKGHYGKVTQFMAPAQTVEFYKNRKSVCLTSEVSSQLAEPLQTVEVFMNCKSINETSEIGSQIIDPNAFVLSNKSQQTETSTMQLDQGVQTYRNEVSTDIATNTDDLHTGQSKNRINSEMVASTIASESKAHKIYKLPNGLVKQRESTITNNLSTQVDFSQCPSSVNELRQNFILTTSEEMLPDIVYTTIQEEQTNDSSTVLHKSLNSISTLPQENLASISGQFKDWIYTASEEMLPEINQPIIQQELVPSMTKIQRGLITSDPTHNGEPPIRMLSTRETIDVAPMKSASIYELASISIGDTSEVQQKQEVIPEKPKQEQIKCSEHDFCNWQAQRAPSIIHKSIADSLHDEPIPVNFYLKQISDASSWQDEQLSNIDESIQEKSIFSIEIDKSLISDKCLIKEDISKRSRAQSGEVLSVKFPEIDNSMSVKKLVDNQSINDQEPLTATEYSKNAIGEIQQPNQSISHRSSSSMDSSKEVIGEFQQSECQPECKSNELKTESHLSTEPKQLSSAMESKQVLDETDRSVVPESNNGNESKAVSPSISKQKLEPLTDTLGMLVLTTEMLAKIHKQLAQLRMMPNRSTSSCQGKRQQKTKKSFESLSTTALESIPESSTQNETDKNIETITKVQQITDNVSRISDIPTESPSIVNDDTLAATAKCESKLESKDASSSKTSLLEINLSIYHQDCILDGSGSKTKLGPLKVTESEIIFRHLEVASKLSIPIDQLEPLVNSTTKETSILYTPVNFHLNKMEMEEESKQSLPEINSSICQQDVIPAAESIKQHTPKEEEDIEQARGDQPQMASTTTTSEATPITAECSLSNSSGLETGAKSKEILPQNKKRIKFDYQSMASDSSQASEPLIDTHKIITDIRKFIKMLHPVDQAKLIADKPITEEKSLAIEKTTCYQNQKLEHVEEAVKRSPEIEPNLDNQSISQNETLMCKVSENGMDEDIDRLREKNCAAIDKVSKFNESITPTLIVSPAKWQHQRYIIAASRFIIKQFKCNPAYQCSALQPDAPDFYEQWKQFIEIAAAQASCPKPTIDVANIKRRLKLYLRCMRKQYLYQPEECLAAIGKCQLQQLLTKEELEEYERLRWQQRDRGMTVKLNAEERLVDAQHALLGYECQQLRASARSTRLMLRSPHHQSSISESYLLLALAEVGHYYRCLQQQHDLLPQQLGEYGRALTPCLMAELHAYSRFYQCHKEQGTSLIQVYQQSRRYVHRFQWLLHLCDELSRHQSPLQYLQQQLGLGCGDYDEVLKQWLQCAAEPLLKRIRSWLQLGELLPGDFFIVDTGGQIENYWLEQFELLPEQLPHFINKYLAQQLLATGRNQHFARHFLGRQLELVVQESELQQQLAAACVSSYREMDEQPLIELLGTLQLDTSRQLFEQLQQLRPDPLELLTRLHQYLLLTDVEFVREMIELLEPVLEQPAECYCAVQLNNMLEQLLGVYNKPLYVVKGEQQGSRCWCCFLLRWQQPCHWKTLLGGRLRQYESCFVCLWQLHYADYVLNERIRRQQSHFWERINLEQSQEARQVRDRFDQFIDRLQEFMLLLRSYMLENVLDRALAKLYLGCNTVKTLDELLQLHSSYMDRILNGLFLTRDYARLRLLLVQLYEPIFQLDVVQQKFLSICQLIYADDDTPQRQLKVRSCCQSTCDAIHDLEQDFQLAFANLLLGLYNTNQPQACGLAKKLDRRGYYEQRYKELKIVHTFRYQRKFQIQKNSRLANL